MELLPSEISEDKFAQLGQSWQKWFNGHLNNLIKPFLQSFANMYNFLNKSLTILYIGSKVSEVW